MGTLSPAPTPKYLISACLCGCPVRYDGGGYTQYPLFRRLVEQGLALAFCPECAGGLPVPRLPAECRGSRVVTRDGDDCTQAYERGARKALALCREVGIRVAILKENSPSCGTTRVYDGRFRGVRIPGEGVTARLLRRHGIRVLSEEQALTLVQDGETPLSASVE